MNRLAIRSLLVTKRRADGGREVYLYRYLPGQEADMLRLIGRQAADPHLSLTWYEAARLSNAIRRAAGQRETLP